MNWNIAPDEVFHKEYVSFSRLNMYNKCPRQFELIYLYKNEDISGRAAQRGQLVHKILEMYLRHRMNDGDGNLVTSLSDLLAYLEPAYDNLDLDYQFSNEEIKQLLRSFEILNRSNLISNIYEVEKRVQSKCGDYSLECVIDRIDKVSDGSTRLIDYKTGKSRYVKNVQLEIYALALENLGHTPNYLQYQFLGEGNDRSWNYNQNKRNGAESWMMDTVDKIENNRSFPRRQTGLCPYCSVRSLC